MQHVDLYFASGAEDMQAAAGTWAELEALYPSLLRVTVVESPGKLPAVQVAGTRVQEIP